MRYEWMNGIKREGKVTRESHLYRDRYFAMLGTSQHY